MTKQDEKIAEELKGIIDTNGKNYLSDTPYEVYKRLIENVTTDKKIAGAILCALVNGLQDKVQKEDFSVYSQIIQQECGFDKQMADRLATIFRQLYSKEHNEEWKSREKEGLKLFLKETFIAEWKGYSVWEVSNGCISCHYNATIMLQPQKKATEDMKLKQMLVKNPFVTKKIISEYFADSLRRHLDYAFEDYCTCDDYYPPVVEDFELEYNVKEWCQKNGFKIVSCEGEGSDGGYEPNL